MSYYTFGEDAPSSSSASRVYATKPAIAPGDPRHPMTPVVADPCNACYDAKSEAYRACQQQPAGSAQRESCFRQADADLGNCLDACRGKPAGSTAKLLLLGGAAVVAVALLT